MCSPSTTSTSPWTPAPCAACSAPTAPGRPPRCACSWASSAPPSGEARVFDTRVTASDKVLRRVGAMIEHAAFYPYLSGVSNLRIYWQQGGGSWPPANLDDSLAVAGLGDAVHRRVKTYSHGMKQRLGICRVLLGEPEILMLDEPTNGLDPGEIREIRRLMQRLADRGTTVLLSSHLLGEIEQTCSHVVVMDRGHLVAAGTVASFVGRREVGLLRGRRHRPGDAGARRAPGGGRGHAGAPRAHRRARRAAPGRARRRARPRRRRGGDGHGPEPARGRVPRVAARRRAPEEQS